MLSRLAVELKRVLFGNSMHTNSMDLENTMVLEKNNGLKFPMPNVASRV
jgi:hypothetical protein